MGKFVLMYNSTSQIDRISNVFRHFIVRPINLIRSFGFLRSQRKKCLLLQYSVLIPNHNTYNCAHTFGHLAFLTVRLLWNLHKPIFEFSSFDFCQENYERKQNKFLIRHVSTVHVRLSHGNWESFFRYFLLCEIPIVL